MLYGFVLFLKVLDTCFTGESLCSVLGVPAKNPLRAEVQAKFTELVGEEVAGEKTEASKLDGYAVLIAGQKAKVCDGVRTVLLNGGMLAAHA